MARLAVLLAIAILGYLLWQELKKRSPQQRRKMLLRGALFGVIGLVLVLALTGRVHWIMAAAAAAIPFIKVLFGLLLRALPFLQIWHKQHRAKTEHSSPAPTNSELTEDEAWQLLGLKPGANREEITKAHKSLIQKLHPDRGGNDYLAAKLNAARDLLLGK